MRPDEPCALALIRPDGEVARFAVDAGGGLEAAALAALVRFRPGDVLVAEHSAGHSIRVIPPPWEVAEPARRLRLVQ